MGSTGLAAAHGAARVPVEASSTPRWSWLERESLVVFMGAAYSAGLLLRLPQALSSDSWLTLVYGRELWHHGLPRSGDLTAWTHGLPWVDQQWLAQAFFGGLASVGGVRSALVAHAVLLIAALVVAMVAARRLGGSPRRVPLVALLALPALWLDWVLRAQSLAYLLFVAAVWLLVSDAGEPSRRVYAVLPLLIVWANVHGSVLLAAALVCVRGLTLLRTHRRRGILLVTVPWLCVLTTPYGPAALTHYYRSLLFDPLLSALVPEWGRTTPSLTSLGFYALAFLTVWLAGRCRGMLSLFEHLALLVLLVDGLVAVRNMVWFCLAAIMIVPRLLDHASTPRDHHEAPRLVRLGLPLAVVAAAATALVVGVHRAGSHDVAYPAAAAAAVARAAAEAPGVLVFADTKYADWLMWERPALRGRIAYDARFELLRRKQLVDLYLWRSHIGRHWELIPGCKAIVVVNRLEEPLTERDLLATRHARRIFESAQVAVLVSRQPGPTCRHDGV